MDCGTILNIHIPILKISMVNVLLTIGTQTIVNSIPFIPVINIILIINVRG